MAAYTTNRALGEMAHGLFLVYSALSNIINRRSTSQTQQIKHIREAHRLIGLAMGHLDLARQK